LIVIVGVVRNGNSVGKIGEGPPSVCRSESIVEDARVDQIGTQTTEGKTAFGLVGLFITIFCFN
jgi:hypothetical protein